MSDLSRQYRFLIHQAELKLGATHKEFLLDRDSKGAM